MLQSRLIRKELKMSREIIPKKERTTIIISKKLLDRIGIKKKKKGESQTDFITRAVINQLENDGDLTIRREMEEEYGE